MDIQRVIPKGRFNALLGPEDFDKLEIETFKTSQIKKDNNFVRWYKSKNNRETDICPEFLRVGDYNTGGLLHTSQAYSSDEKSKDVDTRALEWEQLAQQFIEDQWGIIVLPEFLDNSVSIKPLLNQGYHVATFVQENDNSTLGIAIHSSLGIKIKEIGIVPFGNTAPFPEFNKDSKIASQSIGFIDIIHKKTPLRIIGNHTTAPTTFEERIKRFEMICWLAKQAKGASIVAGDFNPYGPGMDMTTKLLNTFTAKWKFPLSYLRHAGKPVQNNREIAALQQVAKNRDIKLMVPATPTFFMDLMGLRLFRYKLDLIAFWDPNMAHKEAVLELHDYSELIPQLDHHGLSVDLYL